jgi:hypothetical protein
MLVRAGNFAGSALAVFAGSTAIISPYHHYFAYALLAVGGAALLLLAHRARSK